MQRQNTVNAYLQNEQNQDNNLLCVGWVWLNYAQIQGKLCGVVIVFCL